MLQYLLQPLLKIIKMDWINVTIYLFTIIFVTPLIMHYDSENFYNYWTGIWFAIVTITTVGYGDFYPVTLVGRLWAIFLMFSGIGAVGIVLGKITSFVFNWKIKKMNGEITYYIKNHIVIIGYKNNTRELVKEILSDELRKNRKILLIAKEESNPIDEIDCYVRDKTSVHSDDAFKRACVSEADKVIIYGDNDEENLASLISVVHCNPDAYITVWLNSSDSVNLFKKIKGNIELVQAMEPQLICQAMQDKVNEVLSELLSNNDGQEIYMITIPEGKYQRWWYIYSFSKNLKHCYDMTLIAIKKLHNKLIVNPDLNMEIRQGDSFWVISKDRPMNIDWSIL